MSKTPKLRFKEFSGDWESKKVKQLMNEKIIEQPLDGNHGDIHPTTNDYVETGIPFIMASDLYNGKVDYLNCKYISEETAKGLRKGFAKEGDILITHKATIGEIALVKNIDTDYIVLTPQVTYYRVNDYSILNNIYLKSYFESENFMNTFKKIASDGSTRSYIGITKQQELDIIYPKIEEQEKIASFFSLIDDKISLQSEKVEALKAYKRGMMQKIFSRELRFKDDEGRDYPEWEEKKLGDVLSIPEKIKEDNVSKDKLLTVKLHRKGIQINENTETLNIGSTTYYKRKAGQIIYGKQNFFNGAIDIVPDKFDGFISSGDVPSLDVNKEIADVQFILNIIGRDAFYKRTESLATGTGSKRLHENVLFTINIDLPCLNEQKKIVNLLNVIYKKIEKEQEKLDSLNEYKKGLLQQMFV